MNHQHPVNPATAIEAPGASTEASIPELVATVYEQAPATERGRLLEQLMRPLGVLSLFGIAGGVFASIRLRSGWQQLNLNLEDIQQVHAAQVISLVERTDKGFVETRFDAVRFVPLLPGVE